MTREDGFSLIELVMALGLLGAISTVVTAAIVIGLRTADTSNERIAGSIDRQLLAVYFTRDAQNAHVQLTDGCPDGETTIVKFAWTDPDDPDAPRSIDAAYCLAAGPDARRIIRRASQDGAPERRLATLPVDAPEPHVTCAPSCTDARRSVTLTVSESASAQPFTVSATRRRTVTS